MSLVTSPSSDPVVADKPASLHDSARASPELLDDFHELVRDINRVLGPCNGIDSDGVDVEELKKLMASYESQESDWERYAFADHSRAYTRNLVDRGNGKCNLLVLVWTPGKGSPIHDHANAHCVMKILKGSLTETVYRWPCQSHDADTDADANDDDGSYHPRCATSADSLYPTTEHTCSTRREGGGPVALQSLRATTYARDQVTYMSDGLGLHRVSNPSLDEVAVSLHLYTPPNAAKHGCHVFNESTGKKSHVSQGHFYSELGRKL